MAPEIPTLRKSPTTKWTRIRSKASVLPEVISEIATLLKNEVTIIIPTSKEEFGALVLRVHHLNCLVPAIWDSVE